MLWYKGYSSNLVFYLHKVGGFGGDRLKKRMVKIKAAEVEIYCL